MDPTNQLDAPPQHNQDDDEVLALWRRHVGHAYWSLLVTGDGWEFDPDTQSYVSDHGIRLGPNELRGLALTFSGGVESDLKDNMAEFLRGDISLDEWHERAQERIDDEFLLLAALGAGGFQELTSEDIAEVAGQAGNEETPGTGVAEALERLDRFKEQLIAPKSEETKQKEAQTGERQVGEAGSESDVIRRAGQSADPGYPIYEKARTASHERLATARGIKIEMRSILDPDPSVKHCRSDEFNEGCIEVAAAGWMPIGSLPPIGTRVCNVSCRCSMVYRALPIEPVSRENPTG